MKKKIAANILLLQNMFRTGPGLVYSKNPILMLCTDLAVANLKHKNLMPNLTSIEIFLQYLRENAEIYLDSMLSFMLLITSSKTVYLIKWSIFCVVSFSLGL